MKNAKLKNKILAIIVVFAIFASVIYWQFISSPSLFDSRTSLFKIGRGQTIGQTVDALAEKKMIRSKRAFLLLANLRQLDRKLQPGRYKLNRAMNLQEILNALANPEQGEIQVTIPEGFTVNEIDKRLSDMQLILPGEFSAIAAPMEGFLFPDTYTVYKFNFDPQDLVSKMQNNFLKKITPDLRKEIEKRNRMLPEIITMASILEKEIRTEKDLPVVADILWKRLDAGWFLGADATLLYGKTARTLASEDSAEDGAYNTRTHKGLPPTPIGNPGMATISSAIFPQESPYWYYLTDKESNVHYARTNDEHNENRNLYL